MKMIQKIAFFVAIILTVSVSGCKKQTPADEFVKIIDGITAQIKDTQNLNDIMALAPQMNEGDEFVKNNADYVLTDADKDAIAEALITLTKAVSAKHAELKGTTVSSDSDDAYFQILTAHIKASKTLGDLSSNQGFTPEEEIIEETIEPNMVSDTTATEIDD